MTFCLRGRGVELLIDAVTLALNNQIKIYATQLVYNVFVLVRFGRLRCRHNKDRPGDSPPPCVLWSGTVFAPSVSWC
jgi:hypothetical protein